MARSAEGQRRARYETEYAACGIGEDSLAAWSDMRRRDFGGELWLPAPNPYVTAPSELGRARFFLLKNGRGLRPISKVLSRGGGPRETLWWGGSWR